MPGDLRPGHGHLRRRSMLSQNGRCHRGGLALRVHVGFERTPAAIAQRPTGRIADCEYPFGMRRAVVIDNDAPVAGQARLTRERSEEHTSELQSLMRTSYSVFCLKKKTTMKPK